MRTKKILLIRQNENESLQNPCAFDNLESCLAEIGKARKGGDNAPYTVKISGDHYVGEPILIDSDTVGDDVTIEGDGSARILGGIRLSDIKKDTLSGVS